MVYFIFGCQVFLSNEIIGDSNNGCSLIEVRSNYILLFNWAAPFFEQFKSVQICWLDTYFLHRAKKVFQANKNFS